MDNDYGATTGKAPRRRSKACSAPPPSTKFALAAGLCDRMTFDNAPGEAYWMLVAAYGPEFLPKRLGRVRAYVREVRNDLGRSVAGYRYKMTGPTPLVGKAIQASLAAATARLLRGPGALRTQALPHVTGAR